METIFQAWQDIPITERSYQTDSPRPFLHYSEKDERHRGEYKALRNDVGVFDADGKMIGIVFDMPRRMAEAQLTCSISVMLLLIRFAVSCRSHVIKKFLL